MKLSKAVLITTAAAMAAVGVGAGAAQAADDDVSKFENSSQVLSCDVVEIIDIPILSAANNNIDCSENTKEEESKMVHIVDEDSSKATVLLPRDEHHYR
ncbi:hypothetical protein WDH52_23735 [Streptomyces sp. TRM70308]|uniref:hypothetical protein n=1 Tax=Streptomyces sp. TRM70308 TaxID=3131932 RepID=UPI003D01BED6